jgi:hypothetical protein
MQQWVINEHNNDSLMTDCWGSGAPLVKTAATAFPCDLAAGCEAGKQVSPLNLGRTKTKRYS